MTQNLLLVFAHDDEAVAFANAGVPHLVTGVGKINATLALTEAILRDGKQDRTGSAGRNSTRVVVLGTAGAVSDAARLDTVYQISTVVQHDFSLPSPRLELPGPYLAETATIATGDVFVQDDEQRAGLERAGASLVDMESYAFAVVCARLGMPLQVFKVPSDFADSSTTQDEWDGVVMSKSDQLLAFAKDHLPELFALSS